MKYFDPRTIFLARHAQHIVLVHFPIALLVTTVVFDGLGRWSGRRVLAVAAAYNLYGAALTAPLAAITGVLAWQMQLGGARLRGALLLHLCAACAVIALAGGLALFRLRWAGGSDAPLPPACLAAELVAVVVVTATGHLGGILSGVVVPGG
jgi:uncharacterized membrane protein